MKRTNYSSQITISGLKIPYTVRRNPRARRIWIRVEDEGGLVVVLPKGRKANLIPNTLKEHKEWVLETIQKREERLQGAPPPLGEGRSMVYRGRIVDLRVRNIACENPLVKLEGNKIRVTMPRNSEESLKEVLSKWVKERALLLFSRRVEYFAAKIGAKWGSIQVKNQKTRWGSCSWNGKLAFNWRLLFAPPEVLDYVVIHEVAHLKYHDHSKRFWKLVEATCPAYEKHRNWLNTNGLILKT